MSERNNRTSFIGQRRGRGRRRNWKWRREVITWPIGERGLNRLFEMPPFIIARTLIRNGSGYEELISSENIPTRKLALLLQVLSVALKCTTDSEATLKLLIITFQEPQFVYQLCQYVSELQFYSYDAMEYIPYVLQIIEIFVRKTPVEAAMKVSSLMDICEIVLQKMKEESHEEDVSALETRLVSIQSQIAESRKLWRNDKTRQNARVVQLDGFSLLDDFRTLNIIPTTEELLTVVEPFLRPNIVDGGYSNSEHYLDVQFRLLKEDFFRPLRNGLNHFLSGSSKKNRDVKVYRNVSFRFTKLEENGLIIYLQLDLPKHFNLDRSKRLMFGNIVCLSSDNFKNMAIATVSSRDYVMQQRIGVKLEFGKFDIKQQEKIPLTMIEPKAYYLSYCHTLKALQNIYTVPFEDVLVRVQYTGNPPWYLEPNSIYDLSVLTCGSSPEISNVPVLADIRMWPSSHDLHLDESQRKALHNALTQEVSIIQGPPGTGKTYVGLQITKALLHNQSYWNYMNGDSGGSSPILVVCYTNHALDQFLEGIANFTRAIIRVGSRCKSEVLEDFHIKKAVKRQIFRPGVTRIIKSSFGPLWGKKIWLQREMDILNSKLSVLDETEGILSLSTISFWDIVPYKFRERLKSVHLLIDYLTKRENSIAFSPEVVDDAWDQVSSDDSEDDEINDVDEEEENSRMVHNDYDFTDESHDTSHIAALPEKENSEDLEDDEVDEVDEELFDEEQNTRMVDDYCDFSDESDETPDVDDLPEQENCEDIEDDEVYDVDEELFNEEQNARMVEDDYDFSDESHETHCLMMLAFAITTQDCVRKIDECRYQIQKHPLLDVESRRYYEEIKHYDNILRRLKDGLSKRGSATECHNLEQTENIYDLSLHQRWKLYNYWKDQVVTVIKEKQRKLEKAYLKLVRDLVSLRSVEYLEVMQQADVVGMTTTAAAKYYNILHDLAPPIVILEEAAEILEAHVVTSLSEECQHLILIGDHQQLKPSPSVYQLATKYNLNVSLFERLIRNGINYICLEYQHRMKPCISRLLVPTIYKDLKDHSSVFAYPKIRGIEKDIFFLDHDSPENPVKDDNDSASNDFEAKFAVALCRHLLFQGYGTDEITILTPYSGQHRLIKENKRAYPQCEEVRVAILDNYQGEECNIIILSLVRSNEEDKAGFVKIDNRICVAISRAKHGFYMLGNMGLLARASPIWCEIRGKLVEDGSIGTEMKLKCEIHGQEIIVKSDQDILFQSPEGGCSRNCSVKLPKCNHLCPKKCHFLDRDHSKHIKCLIKCDAVLDCEHNCKRKCHVTDDPDHETYECREKCDYAPDNCQFGHNCPKLCFDDCGPCGKIINRKLKCGHTEANVLCGLPEDQIKCKQKCQKTLPCSHKCPKLCYEPCGDCRVAVKKTIPGCWHVFKMECGVDPSPAVCTAPCEKSLSCGHPCRKKCNEVCTTYCKQLVPSEIFCPRNHSVNFQLPCSSSLRYLASVSPLDEPSEWLTCVESCGAKLECGHQCHGKCCECYNGRLHKKCMSDCKRPLVCGHICRVPCSNMCPPCLSPCGLKCSHSKCKNICGVPCIPCKEVCQRKCEHRRCKKKCGEPCDIEPCKEPCPLILPCMHPCIGFCGEPCPKICRICHADQVTEIFFGTEDEEDARFVALEDCQHVFEASGIEHWMNNNTSEEIGLKKCPRCSTPIYNTKRFQSQICAALEDVKRVKEKHFTKNQDRKEFIPKLKAVVSHWRLDVNSLLRQLGYDINYFPSRNLQEPPISDMEMSLISFQIDFLEDASALMAQLGEGNPLRNKVDILVNRVMSVANNIPDQMRDEFVCELRRISVLKYIIQLREEVNGSTDIVAQLILSEIVDLMDPSVKLTSEKETQLKQMLMEVGVVISPKERKEIVAAMGLPRGHWYKCPKGHIYSIGECGGAMQEAKCPECKCTIGGQSHRLVDGNMLAPEMDGATAPAWPN